MYVTDNNLIWQKLNYTIPFLHPNLPTASDPPITFQATDNDLKRSTAPGVDCNRAEAGADSASPSIPSRSDALHELHVAFHSASPAPPSHPMYVTDNDSIWQKLNYTIPLLHPNLPTAQSLTPKGSKHLLFDSDALAASQSPPLAALTAFAHKVSLGNLSKNPMQIQQVCTHESITVPYSKLHPNKRRLPIINTNLPTLRNSLPGLFGVEFVHSSNLIYRHTSRRLPSARTSVQPLVRMWPER
jgi:hypothetical protein